MAGLTEELSDAGLVLYLGEHFGQDKHTRIVPSIFRQEWRESVAVDSESEADAHVPVPRRYRESSPLRFALSGAETGTYSDDGSVDGARLDDSGVSKATNALLHLAIDDSSSPLRIHERNRLREQQLLNMAEVAEQDRRLDAQSTRMSAVLNEAVETTLGEHVRYTQESEARSDSLRKVMVAEALVDLHHERAQHEKTFEQQLAAFHAEKDRLERRRKAIADAFDQVARGIADELLEDVVMEVVAEMAHPLLVEHLEKLAREEAERKTKELEAERAKQAQGKTPSSGLAAGAGAAGAAAASSAPPSSTDGKQPASSAPPASTKAAKALGFSSAEAMAEHQKYTTLVNSASALVKQANYSEFMVAVEKNARKLISQVTSDKATIETKAQKLYELATQSRQMGEAQEKICLLFIAQEFISASEGCLETLSFCLGRTTALLCSAMPAFVDILLGALHAACPWTIPRCVAKEMFKSDAEYCYALGRQLEEDDDDPSKKSWESPAEYSARVVAIFRYYIAILVADVPNHPLGIDKAWTLLARMLNQAPTPAKTSADVLCVFITSASFSMNRTYGRQYVKLLQLVKKEFMPRLKKNDQAFAVIDNFLNNYNSNVSKPPKDMPQFG